MNALLALAQFLPTMLQLGIAAKPMIETVLGKSSASTDLERYAHATLVALPNLIDAGIDIASLVMHTHDQVKAMLAEGRGPTTDEWQAQADRINALEQEWQAARKTTGG